MSKKTYDILTTVSLFAIAVSAILSDRLRQLGWLFGGVAVACGVISTWIYFRHGMQKARELDQDCDRSIDGRNRSTETIATNVNDIAPLSIPDAIQHWGADDLLPLRQSQGEEEANQEPRTVSGIVAGESLDLAQYLKSDQFLVSRGSQQMGEPLNAFQLRSYFAVTHVTQTRRTFAEEVVEIVKGLTALSESPIYEIEFKADGTLKVVPCSGTSPSANQAKKMPQAFESMKTEDRVH
jgi:hypothetical protein